MNAEAYSLLVKALTSGRGSERGPALQELLGRLGETDPRASLVASYLAQRQADREEAETEEKPESAALTDGGEVRKPALRNSEPAQASLKSDERRRALLRLQQLVRSMYAELEELRARNDQLALALGACYLCWGEDPDCEVCGGEGTPGSSPPDKALFAQLVVPAASRLRARPGVGPSAARHRRANGIDSAANPQEISAPHNPQ